MKSVIYITVDFPPYRTSGIYRPTRFGNRWVDQGTSITVLTVKNHLSDQIDDSMLEKIDPRIKVIRCTTPLPRKLTRRAFQKYNQRKTGSTNESESTAKVERESIKQKIKKHILSPTYRFIESLVYLPDEYIFWVPFAIRQGLRTIRREKCDLIFASSPPHSVQLVGLALKLFTGKKYVTDFRNSWTDNRIYNNGITRLIDRFFEKLSLKKADMIITMSPGDKQKLIDYRGEIIRAEIVPITNGYTEEDFAELESPQEMNNRFRLIHLGTVYGRSGEIFLDAFQKFVQTFNPDPDRFEVEFAGIREPALEDYVVKLGLEKYISFAGFINYRDIPAYLSNQSDMLLVLTIGDRFFSAGVLPGKIFEYMRSGKQILHIGQKGDTHDYLAASNLEIYIDQNEIDRIPEVLEGIYRKGKTKNDSPKPNMEAIARFEWNNLADNLKTNMCRLFS